VVGSFRRDTAATAWSSFYCSFVSREAHLFALIMFLAMIFLACVATIGLLAVAEASAATGAGASPVGLGSAATDRVADPKA
jgi:hypothetical protein